jgi:hypothetical protein
MGFAISTWGSRGVSKKWRQVAYLMYTAVLGVNQERKLKPTFSFEYISSQQ